MPNTIAICIGRFQPFHLAHAAMLSQALALASQVVVVLGSAFQARTPKNPFTWDERAEMIRAHFSEQDQARLRFLPMRDVYDQARWARAVQQGVTSPPVDASASSGPPRGQVSLGSGPATDLKACPPLDVSALCGPPRGQVSLGSGLGVDLRNNITTELEDKNIVLVAHSKDASSSYLKAFPNWDLVPLDLVFEPESQEPIHASRLRDAWWAEALRGADAAQALSVIAPQIPHSTLDFLQRWTLANPNEIKSLAEHWQFLNQYKAAWAQAPYPPVFVTVDTLVTCQNHVLLIRRGQAPGKGLLALPGGFIDQREDLFTSAVRELMEETQLDVSAEILQRAWRQTVVFDHPGRSQRGRTITHTHHFELDLSIFPTVQAADDAASVAWIAKGQLTTLEDQFHDDHFHMLDRLLGILPTT
jgi:bifunctional NMN adenylyltransferase/nudix hydrolase